MGRTWLGALLLITLAMISTTGLAQSGATSVTITGKITDTQDAVIPGAVITARNLKTNFERTATTDERGLFTLLRTPPGKYQITVSAEGFNTDIQTVNIELGVTALLNFVLTVGNVNDIIEVRSASNAINEAKTENSTNIPEDLVMDLPINRRNFLDFALTTAGVVRDRGPALGVGATSNISFNGQTARGNNITIDGLDNNDSGLGAVRSTYSQDAVQEFQVVSGSYSAEFGRALGGVVNIVTKGGGNEFHGGLFFLNRNDSTSSRDVFAPFEPEYKQYQFGTTFSGPIKKDRAFFFGSFERLSIKQNNFVTIADATVLAARNLGFQANNGPIPFALNTTSLLGRIDAKLSSQDNLTIRYNYGGTFNGAFEPFGALVGESNGGKQLLNDNTGAITNTYVSAALNLVNETRFLFARRDQEINPLGNDPQVNIFAPEGLVVLGQEVVVPQSRTEFIYQLVNNISLTRGRHQIKFGGDILFFDLGDTSQPLFPRGFAVFLPIDFAAISGIPGLPSFSGLQAFDPSSRTPAQRAFLTALTALAPIQFPGFPQGVPFADLSLPVVYIQGFGDPDITFNQKLFSFFFQNDINVTPNLMIKAGVRYDLNRVKFQPDNNGNVSPRFAITYRPGKQQKLNLRASYGLFFSTPLSALSGLVELTSVRNSISIPVVPFPFSVLPFSMPGRSFTPGRSVPPGVNITPQLTQSFTYEPDFRNSYAQQVSAGFDYLINKNNLVSATYNFVRGIKLVSVRNINPVVRPVSGNPLASQLTGRIDPDRGEIFQFESAYDSYFNAITLSYERRLMDRFNIRANYTYSKAIDNFIDIVSPLLETNDPLNPGAERGLSLQDVRNRFVLSGVWRINYTKRPLLRDYELSTIVTVESGKPYNLLAGADLNLNSDNPPGDRPTALGRNVGITPGFANIDLRLAKTVIVSDRVKFEGIFEVFNLFNRVNISEIDRVFAPDSQGRFNLPAQDGGRFIAPRERFRNAFAPRQIQLGFRLSF